MEEVKEEVQAKPELKEEYILPLLETGVDVDSIISTIKREDEEFIEALVNVTKKEEKHPVKFDSETKPSILTSLVKVCSGRDVSNDHDDLGLKNNNGIKVKTEEEYYGEEFVSSVADTSHQADFEERVEENYDSDRPEENFRDLADLQNTPNKPSSPPQANPARAKKVKKYMCKYCDKRFPDSSALKSHTRTHTGERPFECSFCWKRFISKTLLKLHMSNHTGRRFCCSICSKRFVQSQGLELHMLIHEEKRPFKCAHCGIAVRQKSGLLRHIRRMHMRPRVNKEIHSDKETLIPNESVESNHSLQQRGDNNGLNKHFKNSVSGNTLTSRDDLMEDVNRFTCDDCGKTFKCRQSIIDHMQTEHPVNRFTCDDCGQTFKSRQSIIDHMQTEHPVNRFTCDDCGKTFKCRQSIINHMKNFHFQENKGQYCCRICGIESTNKSNLKKHKELHYDVYPFKCEHCNMSFKQKLNLTSHYRQAHKSGKPYKCVDCGSCFKLKSNLVIHIEVHHSNNEEMFSCHICNMKFKRKCYLKRHIDTHTDADKKYVCDECGLRCRSKTDIAKHVQTHFGTVERPNTCEECGSGFIKRSHLVRHRRVHSDERTFRCQLCDKAYKDTTSLKMHHETVHCGASFLCKVCGFSSVNRSSFNRHFRKCQG